MVWHFTMLGNISSQTAQSNRTLTEFYLQRVLPEVGVVIVHVGLDRGTKKSLLVESFESLPVYFGIVSSRKDYFTLTVVSCDLHNPLGA